MKVIGYVRKVKMLGIQITEMLIPHEVMKGLGKRTNGLPLDADLSRLNSVTPGSNA